MMKIDAIRQDRPFESSRQAGYCAADHNAEHDQYRGRIEHDAALAEPCDQQRATRSTQRVEADHGARNRLVHSEGEQDGNQPRQRDQAGTAPLGHGARR